MLAAVLPAPILAIEHRHLHSQIRQPIGHQRAGNPSADDHHLAEDILPKLLCLASRGLPIIHTGLPVLRSKLIRDSSPLHVRIALSKKTEKNSLTT